MVFILTDGMIFRYRGSSWLASEEVGVDGMIRFVCTPVHAPDG